MMMRKFTLPAVLLCATSVPSVALADASAELYTTQTYLYGRFEARIIFPAGDGVVGSFFLWKVGSEVSGAFWNELDFEKIGADCQVQTNALFGNPGSVHKGMYSGADLCATYHDYRFDWTPDYIAWAVDGQEIRRETGETATAFAQNATDGMRIHFNIWPGDASFGGNYDPSILPVYQYISWVAYSSYEGGSFNPSWREDFDAGLPSGWATGDWGSPKNKSTHNPSNVGFVDGIAVLALTTDGATGMPATVPADGTGTGGTGSGGTGAGGDGTGGTGEGGMQSGGASNGGTGTGGTETGGTETGGASTGGTGEGGAPAAGASNGGASNGGVPAGGATAGGASNGGASNGGVPTAGAPAGGASSGGAPAGGASSGGAPAGGASSGGAPAGGAPAGGVPTAGGVPSGGSTLGGSPATGGDATSGAAPADAESDDAGCGCRVRSGSDSEGWWSGLAILALLLGRRRRGTGRNGEPTARCRPTASRGESIAAQASTPEGD